MEGGALRVGLGCGEDEGMWPTLVSYLHGAGVGAAGSVEATTVAATAGMAGALWLAGAAAMGAIGAVAKTVVGGDAAAAAAVSAPGLDPPVGGGEERRTWGLKLCPPRVLTMPRPKKGRRWREWEEEDFLAKEEKGFEMKNGV